ncbi:unnamed protein product [Auanema sp. JU1783]|nr:unnamed protein product [Auanema sp. JU1783]
MLKRPGEHGEPHAKKLWSKSEARIWTITLFSGTCMLYASRVALPISVAQVSKEFGWTKTDSGTFLSCFFWGYALTQIFAGSFADGIGGEKILPYNTLCWTLLTFFTPQLFEFAYWSGIPVMFIVLIRVSTGIGQGFHLPSVASLISQHLTSSDKGRVFGIVLAGSHCGTVLAGSFGSYLLDKFGWRAVFQFFGIISLMWYYWLSHFLKKFERPTPHLPSDQEHLISKRGTSFYSTINNTKVPWRTLFRHPGFWAAAVAQYTGGNAYFTMFNWLPSYFHEEFPTASGVIYNVVPSLAIVLTSMVAPYMAVKLLSSGHSVTSTRRIMEGLSLIGVAICLFIVPGAHSFLAALLMFTLAMASRGLHHGGVSVNPHDFAPHHTGSVFGIFNACGAITGFIGVYVAGHILEATDNNWSYVFIVTGLQCIFGAAVYGLFGTGNKII